ncbi:O-antigen ligase family protein [Chryseobacterium arthrosphaerae]|uniref:O-antigen ligase family protein n=1 Tax=Chryseobacterium arthrosphaerae TaxID=651561 RepID=UPI0023E138DF|nr:O-antigen ligase family protein [Chryseobacterium arthrosphaerae]WET00143.1 O-antigen ligase family protein [Chryseobacterium arthrosphaerae]
MDITLFSAGICLMIMLFEIKSLNSLKRVVYVQIFLILSLMFLFMISNLYTISYIYSEKKNTAMILNFFTVLYPFIAFKRVLFKELQKLMYLVGVLTIGILFYVYFTITFIIFFDVTQAIESVPTYLAVGIMLSACFIFSLSSKPSISVIAYRLVILFLLTQLGGRGPLINLILSLGIYYVLNLKNLKFNYKVVLAATSAILFIIFYLDKIIGLIIENVNIDRFNLVKASAEDGSVLYRVMVMNKAIDSFYNHPFAGLGIGSGGIVLTGQDQVEFPHNLVLESLMEVGILGGLLYLSIYIYFFVYHLRFARKNKKLLIMYIVALLFFLEDMKSGSFDTWRISLFWICIYMIQYNFQTDSEKSKIYLEKTFNNK